MRPSLALFFSLKRGSFEMRPHIERETEGYGFHHSAKWRFFKCRTARLRVG